MKIAIIGTHSTGKTTIGKCLSQTLQERGNRVHYLPELSRSCPMIVNEHTTIQAQEWILTHQVAHEAQTYEDGAFLICDRATLDNFAYMHRSTDGKGIEKFEQHAVNHMGSYGMVFKTTKLDIDAMDDGFRSLDGTFRDEIDIIITNLLHKHGIRYHALPKSLKYQDHIDFILEKIDAMVPIPEPLAYQML
mgnify:FL=1